MASIERRYLVPDENILSEIFSATIQLKSTNCHIISSTFDTCTFSIQHDNTPLSYPNDVIVRLETSRGRLAAVAAIQRLCHAQLADLVPAVLHVGTATTADARQVEYSISPYCTGTVSLEDVWDTLDKTHQLELVDLVVHAMEKLQKLDVSNVYQSLPGTPFVPDHTNSQPVKRLVGGPNLGYYPDVKQLLGRILQISNQTLPTCELLDLDGGIALDSIYDDMGRVELSHSELDDLQQCAVCCHNDLEPRNILVKKVLLTEEKGKRYEVVALVDWEMAGFYPFAYEYGLKDTILDECHTKFVKALRIIDKSKKRQMMRNVGVRFQAKWIEREQVELSSDLR
ncbi:hypothetical protein F5883DRAFT_700357 [Diaporthe sp. PMI_573]|nr:hypothetical protein F5883DRAFT_700357 [Diaporthaceae sp. PMI_573]